MGKFFRIMARIVVALPMIAGFVSIPHSAKSQYVGTFPSGLASYCKQASWSVSSVVHV